LYCVTKNSYCFELNPIFCMLFQIGKIDWNKIQIDDKLDDEGGLEFASEEQVYTVLGLNGEDDREKQERERRTGGVGPSNAEKGCDESSGAIPIFQHLPGERKIFDRNNLVMDPGSLYPNMKEFKLAMRQYAIDKEFELGVEATDKTRYRGYCRGRDCPWSINASLEHKVWDVVVVSVLNEGNLINVRLEYTSSGRRTSTPTSTWVSYKALPILMSESELGAKKLQKRLQEKYNIIIGYDTV
jgi:hypothetical protein